MIVFTAHRPGAYPATNAYAAYLDLEPPPIPRHHGPIVVHPGETFCANCGADILPTFGVHLEGVPPQCRVRDCCTHPRPVTLADVLRPGEYELTR